MSSLETAKKQRKFKQRLLWWLLPLTIIGGWFYPVLGFFIVLCMIAGMGIAIFRGRYWCDWMCPRGSAWDLYLSKISRQRKIPAFFRHKYFRLIVLGAIITVILTQIPRAWPSVEGMGRVFVTMLTVTSAVGIVLGIPTHHRNWCTYCPIGTLSNWVGKDKQPLLISSSCTQCQSCDKVCPIQIRRWEYRPTTGQGVVPEGDCLKCGLCVEACPKGALGFADGEREKCKV